MIHQFEALEKLNLAWLSTSHRSTKKQLYCQSENNLPSRYPQIRNHNNHWLCAGWLLVAKRNCNFIIFFSCVTHNSVLSLIWHIILYGKKIGRKKLGSLGDRTNALLVQTSMMQKCSLLFTVDCFSKAYSNQFFKGFKLIYHVWHSRHKILSFWKTN